MPKLPDHLLARKSLVRGVRMRVRYELSNMQDRILNDIEVEALKEFDRAVMAGEDYRAVSNELLSATLDVQAALR